VGPGQGWEHCYCEDACCGVCHRQTAIQAVQGSASHRLCTAQHVVIRHHACRAPCIQGRGSNTARTHGQQGSVYMPKCAFSYGWLVGWLRSELKKPHTAMLCITFRVMVLLNLEWRSCSALCRGYTKVTLVHACMHGALLRPSCCLLFQHLLHMHSHQARFLAVVDGSW
jgi:hypothetical protein